MILSFLLFLPYATWGAKPENAYIAVLKTFFQESTQVKYIAVDLSSVKLEDTSKIVDYLQSYCDENGVMLLLDDFDGLVDKGYIKENDIDSLLMDFEDGVLLQMNDVKLTRNLLITDAGYSSMAGWRFVAMRIGYFWIVFDQGLAWIT